MRDSDLVYKKIRDKIITTEYKPGQVLNYQELQDEFNIGRTPIREALNKLAWEGQVRIVPRQCILVSELSMIDMQSIYDIRYCLCELEGVLAARKRTQKDIDLLQSIVEKIDKEKDMEASAFLDIQFHNCIAQMTKNKFLEEELNKTLNLCIRLLFLSEEPSVAIFDSSVNDYNDIVKGIIKQDEEKTVENLKNHLMLFRRKFLK